MNNRGTLEHYFTFCTQAKRVMDRGIQAELRTVRYLYENLNVGIVGDYRGLVNYNFPMQGADSLEIDVLLINKFGVFLIEIKGWLGQIDAYKDYWMVDKTDRRENALESINAKARIFHAQIFGYRGKLSAFRDVSVTGIVVLTQGVHRFKNHSDRDGRAVVGLNTQLLQALSSRSLLHKGFGSMMLSDAEIQSVYDDIYGKHIAKREELVEGYRVVRKLSEGDLFVEDYEAQNVNLATQRVRLKRYQLQKLPESKELMEADILHFKRDAEAVSALGPHPNILNVYNFFPDAKRPDVFYEVTELVTGERLDKIMERCHKILSLEEQLDYLEPLCAALRHAHNHKGPDGRKSSVYHRNISPETIFITNDKEVRLADFDFAKFGPQTVYRGDVLIDKAFTAPEVLDNASVASAASDIYALGVLWYFLACLPAYDPKAKFEPQHAEAKIDALNLSEAACALMKRMVARVAVNRPQNIEEVFNELKNLRKNR